MTLTEAKISVLQKAVDALIEEIRDNKNVVEKAEETQSKLQAKVAEIELELKEAMRLASIYKSQAHVNRKRYRRALDELKEVFNTVNYNALVAANKLAIVVKEHMDGSVAPVAPFLEEFNKAMCEVTIGFTTTPAVKDLLYFCVDSDTVVAWGDEQDKRFDELVAEVRQEYELRKT